MNIDLESLFGYLEEMGQSILPLFSIFGVVFGLYLLAKAAKALVWGAPGAGGPSEQGPGFVAIGVNTMIGACLIQFGTSLDWTTNGLLSGVGSGARATMAYVVTNPTPTWNLIIRTCFLWLQVVGVAGVFKGFLKWQKAGGGDNQGGQGDSFWSGVWHILGGGILINIGSS